MIQGADSPLILCTVINKYMKISEIIDAIDSEIVARGLYIIEVTVSKDNDVAAARVARKQGTAVTPPTVRRYTPPISAAKNPTTGPPRTPAIMAPKSRKFKM